MTITAKLSVEGEIKFSSLHELYSWEHYEEIKELIITNENLIKIPKLPASLLEFWYKRNQTKNRRIIRFIIGILLLG